MSAIPTGKPTIIATSIPGLSRSMSVCDAM
jgi:hypothetical protein